MKILCSVSSGLSSVMMAVKMKEWYPNSEIINVMANTSKERIESLQFMDKCDKFFGLNLVWIEADINLKKGVGVGFVIKTFETLSLNGEVFEQGIKKHGIPSVANKWCNRDLKVVPIHKYIKSLGWEDYYTAIGIRVDEIDRISAKRVENKIIYPLFDKGITKRGRNYFWSKQPFSIDIEGFKGNCDLCFEKTMRKLATIYKDDPKLIDWWIDMENKYSQKKIQGKKVYNGLIENYSGAFFLRGNKSIKSAIDMSKTKFKRATDEYVYENDLFDLGGGCDQGCSLDVDFSLDDM